MSPSCRSDYPLARGARSFGEIMKTILQVYAVSLLSLGASAATIRIDPTSSLATVGDTVNVNVNASDVTDLYAFQFDLAFNPAVLSASAVTEGGFLGNGGGATFFILGTIDNALGTITLTLNALLGPEPGVTGCGSLAGIRFTAIGAGTSAVTLSNTLLIDAVGSDIAAQVANGSVTVSGNEVPEPSSAYIVLTAVVALFVCAQRCSFLKTCWREGRAQKDHI